MEKLDKVFGSLVFNDETMKSYLSRDVYEALKKTREEGKELEINIANSVANAMKMWALDHGCSYYTHWFQPMTGITAEKHESFISPQEGGKILLEFSGKNLIKGENDASSFPSGGLRATWEGRGYTAWDPTSYAFLKDDTLCIPTAFCSYSGDALDKKTPLLKSMEALGKEAIRVVRLFGMYDVKRVFATVGPEQEYFLINKSDYAKREDLMFTGRTLIGARSPKGQEMDDHYYGAIRGRVSDFMHDLDTELWKLGINSKTSHNEVAPSQHELAPVYTITNVAVDHNQLTMELMKKIADKHGFACLLHEKPFAGLNGSGKHNNWSLQTDTGVNLLEPGENPAENTRFLLFLVAMIKAVDEYQDLLRMSVATASNDQRLGGNEAPPAIVSMFLGDDLTEILDAMINNTTVAERKRKMQFGVHVLPEIQKDTTDRNRTSPFAFTGNKFEFRMLGSSDSVADPNIVLNTIYANALESFYEKLKDAKDLKAAVTELVKDEYRKHKRIIFNGNNYSSEWLEEAKARGLIELPSAPDAFDTLLLDKNINLFGKFGVYNEREIASRYEVLNDEYSKTIHIEALTLIDMINRKVLPRMEAYTGKIARGLVAKKAISDFPYRSEIRHLGEVSRLTDELYDASSELEDVTERSREFEGSELAHYSRSCILPAMEKVREFSDQLELIVASDYWPYPSYAEMLFYL